MQHSEITDNLGEFQRFLDSNEKTGLWLEDTLKFFDIQRIFKTRALIFDDSPIQKSGKKIEAVSKMHDHVTGRYLFGYKLLVCGYRDGKNFIPVDFSLHRERGNELDKARDRCNRARRNARQAEAAYWEQIFSLRNFSPLSTEI